MLAGLLPALTAVDSSQALRVFVPKIIYTQNSCYQCSLALGAVQRPAYVQNTVSSAETWSSPTMFSATQEIHSPLSMDETFFMVSEAGFLLVSLCKRSEKHVGVNHSIKNRERGNHWPQLNGIFHFPSFFIVLVHN